MLLVRIGCSACPEELEVELESLEDADREVCPCGYLFVVLAVSELAVD